MAQEYKGKPVFKGIALGPVTVLKKQDVQVKREKAGDPESEIKKVEEAVETSKEQLQHLYEKALSEVGEASAAIFEVHQMMLEDEDYQDAIRNMIRTERVSASYAVAVTGDNFAEMFAAMDDDYMQARAADVKDISNRLVENLNGNSIGMEAGEEASIIVADDLTPSETVQLDKEKILGFVTVHGSSNSHTAILARMMNIPAMIGTEMDLDKLENGMTAVLDAFAGTFITEPTEEQCAAAKEKMQEEEEKEALLQKYKGKETCTKNGKKVHLYANIGNVGDIPSVLENDAEGVGLFRSEFLYLGREDFPTEEEQFHAYRQVLQTMAGKKVIIRTMAISGAICGIAGFVIVSGASHTISTATAGGRGFTAIIVAWLSKFNTFIMVAVSFGIVVMDQGAVQIATQYGLNENASDVLLGIILFFLIGAEFFINYRVKRTKK